MTKERPVALFAPQYSSAHFRKLFHHILLIQSKTSKTKQTIDDPFLSPRRLIYTLFKVIQTLVDNVTRDTVI